VNRAVEAARKMDRKEDEALLRIDALGWTYVEEDRLEEAYREIVAGLEIARQIRNENENATQLLALGLAWQARVMIEQGRSTEASQLINEALAIPCKPWIKFRVNLAAGDIALKQGNGLEALRFYEDAAQASQEYGGEGRGYQTEPRIGLAYLAKGKPEEAEAKFQALHNLEQIAIGKLYAEYGLALVAYERGETPKAKLFVETVRKELSRRTTSNLLLKLINKLFEDIEAGRTPLSGSQT
jgi:tetratricopeptide (TPR) repeat protein